MAKILVIDDEVNICSELAELLEEGKHTVHCAENALQAFEKINQNPYDIIFLDVLMPKIEGSEALVEIKKKTQAPVVVMSAYLAPEVEKKVMSAGAYACLRKPFRLKEIESLIQNISSGKIKRQKNRNGG